MNKIRYCQLSWTIFFHQPAAAASSSGSGKVFIFTSNNSAKCSSTLTLIFINFFIRFYFFCSSTFLSAKQMKFFIQMHQKQLIKIRRIFLINVVLLKKFLRQNVAVIKIKSDRKLINFVYASWKVNAEAFFVVWFLMRGKYFYLSKKEINEAWGKQKYRIQWILKSLKIDLRLWNFSRFNHKKMSIACAKILSS